MTFKPFLNQNLTNKETTMTDKTHTDPVVDAIIESQKTKEEIAHNWASETANEQVRSIMTQPLTLEGFQTMFERTLYVWLKDLHQSNRDMEFYRGIVTQIGELMGPDAFTANDGVVGDSVLALKVPELVKTLIEANQSVNVQLFQNNYAHNQTNNKNSLLIMQLFQAVAVDSNKTFDTFQTLEDLVPQACDIIGKQREALQQMKVEQKAGVELSVTSIQALAEALTNQSINKDLKARISTISTALLTELGLYVDGNIENIEDFKTVEKLVKLACQRLHILNSFIVTLKSITPAEVKQ